uniref:Flavoprotein domain-containing protein n=1 Tax=Panagrolaimus sp. PS1159 TaxID=55785 RepID=A0AC35GPT4_9BILA
MASESFHEPPSKKLKEDESMQNGATCSIIPILNRMPYTNKHILRKSFDQFHLLIGVAGSVATIKIAELVEEFHKKNPENLVIKVIATKASLNFFDPTQLPVDVYVDEDEWGMWKNRGDPVLHIELRKWADAILIAPMDANTLAKVANGLSDNLLTSVLRAWDFSKYAFFAPAMNTCMWEHPLTGQHLKTLKELLLFKEIPPMEKELMCGDKGYGAMAALPMIVSIVSAEIRNKFAVYTH